MTCLDSIIIGLWQVLAMIPGVSRSSATISGGMLRDFNARRRGPLQFSDVDSGAAGRRRGGAERLVRGEGLAGLARRAAGRGIYRRGDQRLFQHPLAARLSQDPPAQPSSSSTASRLARCASSSFCWVCALPLAASRSVVSMLRSLSACCVLHRSDLLCSPRAPRHRRSRARRSNCDWPKRPIKPPCSIG